ncbi:DUF3015 family protein [Desulfoluna butyratoxydans]|uniref:DUF3015 domain-containing protein n=1 Tax=Desulfoluna butyratoxydans TaxID=231438 RepID=A0A4U8YTS8_9BACT|nr:protein of unknown function duf3015 [Desulfoluna butyratoxydans]
MKKCIITLGILFMLVGTTYGKTVSEDCGCGLGRVAIGEKEGLGWNLLGTFLNGLCGNQTFGMSSGTLECGEPTKFAIDQRINTFVAGNMDNLAMDIASGGGESLSALAEIAQVDPALREPLASELQAHFDTIYPDADVSYIQVADALREVFASI